MNNKKGFTLVEIIAVIALIGLIMLLVAPNLVETFKEGQKKAFEVQVQRVMKELNSEYVDALANGRKSDYLVIANDKAINDFDIYIGKNGFDIYREENGFESKIKNKSLKYFLAWFGPDGLTDIAVQDKNFCYADNLFIDNTGEREYIEKIDPSKIVEGGKLVLLEDMEVFVCGAEGVEDQ